VGGLWGVDIGGRLAVSVEQMVSTVQNAEQTQMVVELFVAMSVREDAV